jgi:hypothetical protein
MAGGLIQLVAYGAQDVFLTGKPQITFFKSSYRRHTHFAMEAIEISFTGNPDFGKKVQVTVSRNADLIGRAYLMITLPEVTAGATSGFSWVNEIGHQIVKSVELEVGGQEIDKHYAEWLSIWSSLTLPVGQETGYNNMIGNVDTLTGTFPGFAAAAGATLSGATLYVPLQFSCNRHSGLYLPLIALQYHEVKFDVEFRPASECYRGTTDGTRLTLGDTSLWVDYIYLDTEERKKFASNPHEYLIEQVQWHGDESLSGLSNRIKLSFNHPCKELYWTVRRSDVTDSVTDDKLLLDWTNYTDTAAAGGSNPIQKAKLRLNGQDRFAERTGDYFTRVQHYQHHTNTGAEGLCSYSFALHPEDHQPSGTVNMSRIDNATLEFTLVAGMSGVDAKVNIFALNYNIFRVGSGMGGLAFAT